MQKNVVKLCAEANTTNGTKPKRVTVMLHPPRNIQVRNHIPICSAGKDVAERTFEISICPVPHAELLQHYTSASSPTASPAFRLRQFNLSDT